jgi:bacterioferritin-associated ferredoxin
MYVCICRAVTLSHLRSLIGSGADCLEAVERTCGAGGDCGTCRDDIRRVLAVECPTRQPQSKAA